MSSLSITVGIAACGRPEGLARCLAAVRAQSTPPNQVVVVDQQPSAAARAAADASELPALSYLEQRRLGLSASRNLALQTCSSAVLAVTDDDCAPDASWLAEIVCALRRAPAPAAVTGPILPLGARAPGSYAVSLRDSDVAVDHAGRIVPWGAGSGANFAAAAALLRRCGGWDERLGTGSRGQAAEDSELLYRLLTAGHVVRYEPDAIVRHEWQTRARRLATRWSYGYGVGALCGLRLAAGDRFAFAMLGDYARLHVRPLLAAVARRDRGSSAEHGRALASLLPGVAYGLRAARAPSSSIPLGAP